MSYNILWNFTVEKGSVFGVAFGMLLYCPPNGFTWFLVISPVSTIFFTKSTVDTFSHLRLNLSILESLCKNRPLNIMMIVEANKIREQNQYGCFFTICKINVYGLEFFR